MKRDQETAAGDHTTEGRGTRVREGAPAPTRGRTVLSLQRKAGNRAVARMMTGRRASVSGAVPVQRHKIDAVLQEKYGEDLDLEDVADKLGEALELQAPTKTGDKSGDQAGDKTEGKDGAGETTGHSTEKPRSSLLKKKKTLADYKRPMTDAEKKEQDEADQLAFYEGREAEEQKVRRAKLQKQWANSEEGKKWKAEQDAAALDEEDAKAAEKEHMDQLRDQRAEKKLRDQLAQAGGMQGLLGRNKRKF